VIGEIIQKVKNLSKQKNKLNYETVLITDFIEKMVGLSSGELNVIPSNIHFEIAEDLHFVIMDKILIAQVLLTLIRICADTMNELTIKNTKILISFDKLDTNTIVIKIKNSNTKYCDDNNESLFFSDINTNYSMTNLSLCHSIIESHGGIITGHLAENSPHGSCFQFTLSNQQHENINHE
jgi:K+-sensing histidine kinase KdpD